MINPFILLPYLGCLSRIAFRSEDVQFWRDTARLFKISPTDREGESRNGRKTMGSLSRSRDRCFTFPVSSLTVSEIAVPAVAVCFFEVYWISDR